MKRTIFGILVLCFVVLPFSGLFAKRAEAIPPFARKYQTACPTCHVVIPRLNPFGRAFRANGYRIPGGADEVFTKDEPLVLGANPWKKMFPNTIWPSDVSGLPPIGIEVITGFTAGFNNGVQTEFTGIDEFAMLMGGTFGESWSFFGDVNLFKFDAPKLGWIDRMFIQYNPDWFGGKGHFNIRFGEFEPRVVGPFSNHRQIQIMSWFMGYLSTLMPSGPRGINRFGLFPNQKGIEVYGGFDGKNGGGWEYAFGVVNGEQAHASDIGVAFSGGPGGGNPRQRGDDNGSFDFDDQKDWYVTAHYKFGGMGVLGGGELDELAATDNWKDNNGKWPSVKIGGYFYKGSTDELVVSGLKDQTDVDFIRAQVDIDIFWGDLNVFGGWTLFRDKFGDGDGGGTLFFEDTDTTMNIYTAEMTYVVYPWLIPTWKYELVQSDDKPTFAKHTITVTALIRANIKFQAGVQFTSGSVEKIAPTTPRIFEDTFSMGIQYDF